MQDFRQMVNRGIRYALENNLTAQGSLVKFSQSLAREYHLNCRTALAQLPKEVEMRGLGGLRLDPDTLTSDAMILLYAPGSAGAHGVSGRSGGT